MMIVETETKSPSPNALPANTQLGLVSLKVKDLERSTDYYQKSIGLSLKQQSKNEVTLGTETIELLTLKQNSGGKPTPQHSGLFHLALLVPDRLSLAAWLRQFLSTGQRLDGASDHLVSEAFYLSDPDGNGIEVYADRPREQWQWQGKQVKIATLPLDISGLLQSAPQISQTKLPDETIMGHVHLKVADLEKARAFYLDTLGLNLMFDASHMGALFVAAGSYHHHLGLNTWQSKGHLADAKALGLDYCVIHVPDSDSLKRLKENLEQSHYEFIYQDNTITLDDPAGNTLKITLK